MAEREVSFGLFGGGGTGRSGAEVRFGEMSARRPEAGVSASAGGGAIYSALYAAAPFSPPAWRWGSNWHLEPAFPMVGRGWSIAGGGGGGGFLVDPRCEDQPRHFLDACTTCSKRLAGSDIFMYTGMPFCSVDCREKRIAMEESRGRKVSPSTVTVAASPPRKEQQKKQKRKASQDIQVPGTVMAG